MKFKKLMAYVLSASIVLSAGGMSTNVFAAHNPSGNGHKIYLKAATLEPGKGALSSNSTKASYRVFSNEEGPYIISFDGPITDETKNSLMKMGVTFLDYTPEYSYLCFMTSDTAEKLKGVSHVADVFAYKNEYKIDPALMSKISGNMNGKSAKDGDIPEQELEVRISTFGIDDSKLTREIENLGASNVSQSGNSIYAKVSADKVEKLSALKSVKFIEEVPEFKINNDKASGIVQSELVSTFGYEGEGQIVGVADTGLDNGIPGLNNGTIHRDFIGRVNKIIDRISFSGADESGHGTHVAGSIAGNGVMSQGKIKGMAPEAKLVVQKIGTADGFVIPGSFEELFQEAYDNGVRIHSDSWGTASLGSGGSYGSWSADLDDFVWSHKDMLIVVSAGNMGPDSCTVGSPGTAKNCLTVGATENFKPYMALYDGSSISDNPSETAFFSSRGCQDGRIKPDVVAPGTYIASTMSSSKMPDLLKFSVTYPGNSNYEIKNGTSMATPITSGSVAVIREYIVKNYNITPSAALLKAFVINGALGQNGYSQDQGWGKVSLYDSMFGTRIINDTDSVSEGQQQSYTISCTRSDRPLKISLVWSDYPASAQNASALVNDLDLIVTSPNGSVTYYGNDFTIPYDSEFDRTNNVENIIINNPVAGQYTVEVLGHSVPHGPQPFALVGSSDFLSTPKTIKATAATDSITVSWDSVPGAVGYDVEVDGMNIVNVSGTSYTHSNLAYNSEHTYRIRAKDSRTYSVWSSAFTCSTQLDTPVVTCNWTDYGIQLTWTPVSQATSYEVYLDNQLLGSKQDNTCVIENLAPKTNYQIFIRAKTDFSFSDPSNTLEIFTPDVRKLYCISSMNHERMDFGAAASQNGKIYVAGGRNGSLYLNSVEAYDTINNTWTEKAPMLEEKSGVRLVEAGNGKIYAIGGFDGSSYLNTVEEYNPVNDSWTVKTGMSTPRSDFGVACTGEKIYVIGGYNGTTLRSVEAYDPNTDTWTRVADMPTARSNFGTGVVNGKITVIGGICDTDNLKAVEEYDPSSGKWTVKNSLGDWNSDFSVSEINGTLFLSGGKNSNQITKYDTLTGSEVKAIELPSNVYGHATVVQHGYLYILGGFADTSCSNLNLCYRPQKDEWVQEESLINGKAFFTAEVVGKKIYVIDGQVSNSGSVKTVEVYDISTGTWSSCTELSEGKQHLASATIDGKIYVCGGDYSSYVMPYSNELKVYDPANGIWTEKANMPEGLAMHKAVSLNGYLYVVGGYTDNGYSQNVYKYDPINDSWSTVAPLPVPIVNHGVVSVNGKIYALGGQNSTGILDSIYVYDPSTDTWTDKEPMPRGLFQFSAAVINGKIYIIGGCDTLGGYSTIEPSSQEELSSVYEYDPVNENWRKKQSLPSAMARNCSVFDGNRIYTMGGMLAQDLSVEIIDTMYSYSPSDKDIIMLDMGSGLMEPKAGEKTLPLSISNVPSDGIYGVDVTIEYDPSTLSVTNITPGTVITDNSAFSYNIDSTLGQINICYNGTQQAIINNGVLANIEFDVLESVNTAKSSTLSFIKDDSKVYGESSCEYTGLELIDGAVDIFIYGDVDGNGICNSIDYGFMNQYLMGMIKNLPGTYAAISGDVDASGAINSIDFALFRAYMLRNITKFPAQTE